MAASKPIPKIVIVSNSPEIARKNQDRTVMPPPPAPQEGAKLPGRANKNVTVTHGHSMAEWMANVKANPRKSVTNKVISPEELAKHNTKTDGWMALRGKVFDVTDYLEYHPGGVPYLMKGMGKDATKMFNNVHNYVNFDSILQGRQVGIYMSSDSQEAAKGSGGLCCKLCNGSNAEDEDLPLTTFDQDDSTVEYKVESSQAHVDVSFWTMGITEKQNLLIKLTLKPPEIWLAQIKLTEKLTDDSLKIKFEDNFRKMILTLQKPSPTKWKSLGTPGKIHNKMLDSRQVPQDFYSCQIVAKEEIGPGHYFFAINTGPEVHLGMPVAWHITLKIGDAAKPYTPVLFLTPKQKEFYSRLENEYKGHILYFLIKVFKDGKLTGKLDNVPMKTFGELEIGGLKGTFDTDSLAHTDRVILLAGGTGIAPFVPVIKFIRENRKEIKVKQMILFQSATTSDDILWKETWETLTKTGWFHYIPYVTRPTDDWKGQKYRFTYESVSAVLQDIPLPGDTKTQIKERTKPLNIIAMACGPNKFTETCEEIFHQLQIPDDNINLFEG